MNARSVAALLFATFILAVQAGAQPSYEVVIEEGLNPRMSPSAVAGMARTEGVRSALGSGDEMPTVSMVKCIEGKVIREGFSHPSMKNDSPIWVVRMQGRFVNHRAAGETRVGDLGYIVVDDADGRIIGFGSMSSRKKARSPARLPFPPPGAENAPRSAAQPDDVER